MSFSFRETFVVDPDASMDFTALPGGFPAFDWGGGTYDASVVPEPSTLAIAAAGLLLLGLRFGRRFRTT